MDKSSVTFYLVNIGLIIGTLVITYVAALFILGAGSVVIPNADMDTPGSFLWTIRNDTGEFFPPVSSEDDGSLNGTFHFESSDDFLLLTLVDYNVTPFYYNGSYGKVHPIGDQGPVNSSGPFAVMEIPEGLHDLSFVVITEPFEYFSGPERTYNSHMIHDQSPQVLVGNNTRPFPEFKNRSVACQAVYLPDNTRTYALLTREPLSDTALYSVDAKPGSVEEYYVNVRQRLVNNTYLNTSFAIVQLLDYGQVPVRHDTSDLVYYGWVNGSDSCSLRLSLKTPDDPGSHKITVLLITDPYDSMEITSELKNYGAGKWLAGDFIDLRVGA